MNTARFDALWIGAAALVALVALQIVWHAWLLPATNSRLWPTLALSVVPLLPGLWACFGSLRRGLLIGGMVSLFYFCHGVSAAYGDANARLLAFAEVVLTVIVIAALGWDARHYRRKPR